jgi:hypothetical protein
MNRAQFSGRPYFTRNGHHYGKVTRWWVKTDWNGWWSVIPPSTKPVAVKRFPPGTYWTQVLPYLNDQNGTTA